MNQTREELANEVAQDQKNGQSRKRMDSISYTPLLCRVQHFSKQSSQAMSRSSLSVNFYCPLLGVAG